ncbi:MAG TPA: hypothetical protein VK550_10050, partial [Polyangiaceae bacterium]|nr:hypothetical protein [Polyangiaceae bacterium]
GIHATALALPAEPAVFVASDVVRERKCLVVPALLAGALPVFPTGHYLQTSMPLQLVSYKTLPLRWGTMQVNRTPPPKSRLAGRVD